MPSSWLSSASFLVLLGRCYCAHLARALTLSISVPSEPSPHFANPLELCVELSFSPCVDIYVKSLIHSNAKEEGSPQPN